MASISSKTVTLRNKKIVTLSSPTSQIVDPIIDFRRSLSTETANTYHYPGMSFDRNKEVEYLDSIYKHPKSFSIVAIYEGRVVANLGVSMVRDNHPWLGHVAYFGVGVLKEFWSTGLIQELLSEMDKKCREVGFKKIEATVKIGNDAGLQIYLENDFVIEGKREAVCLIEDTYWDEYYIAKHLNRNLWQPPTITTDRLLLRPITTKDAEAIFNYAKNPEVSKYTLWSPHLNLQETKKWIRSYVKQKYQTQEFEPWGITHKETPNLVIGTIGCTYRTAERNMVEMGFALSPEYWNKGYVTEAGKAVIDFLFTNTNIQKIYARAKAENITSQKVLLKMGFTFEGEVKQNVYSKNRFWDIKYFGISKK